MNRKLTFLIVFALSVFGIWSFSANTQADVTSVQTMLQGALSAAERANIKSQAIAKIGAVSRTHVVPTDESVSEIDIEIQEIKTIEGGVEVFARAWDKKGNPIGFGHDGNGFVFLTHPL